MTRPALKSSKAEDEFVCLTCSLPECMPNSPRCPVNRKPAILEQSTYNKILQDFYRRDYLKKLKDDLTLEIQRVRRMKAETTSEINRIKANKEIARLKELHYNANLQSRGLKAKNIAERYSVPLHIVTNIGKNR